MTILLGIILLTWTPAFFRQKRRSTLHYWNGTSKECLPRMQGGLRPSKKSWPRQPTTTHTKNTQKNKYTSKPLENRASMLAMWTSTNIKNTKRTQMIPLHTGDEICFFCPCQISGFCFCHGRSFCQSVVFGCLLLFHFSGLIKIDCKQHIPLCIQSLTRVSGSLVEGAIKEWSPASGHDEFWWIF